MKRSRAVAAMIGVVAATAVTTPAVASAGLFYEVIDLGTFGGPNSAETQEFPFVNNRGTVVGFADTTIPDDTGEGVTFHAFRWRHGVLADLGTLPGGKNSVANVVNNHDVAAGYSETGAVDPGSGQRESVAVKWTSDGRLIPLGTLGGDFGFAAAINDRGQIVGPAANTVPDSSSLFGWPTQTRAFLWQRGVMRDLGTLGGPDAAAFFINRAGQVAGFSFTSATPDPGSGDLPLHPFLWRNGRIIDLGTLGGTFGFAAAINNAGEISGGAATAANTTHAFFWKNGATRDMGTVRGDRCSEARFMNAKGQVTGTSGRCDENRVIEEHGFLWQRGGRMINLNAFVPPGSPLTVTEGATINDRGEISGSGRLANGDFHAVLLRPCRPAPANPRCRAAR